MKAVGYTRVSTEEQARSGLGLEAQAAVIRAEAAVKGWELVKIIVDDGYTGRTMNRPGINIALGMLRAGEAAALITADLDRLARDVESGARLIKQAGSEGWDVVVPGWGIDTSTADGRMVTHFKLAIAENMAAKLSEWTRAALAAKKARGFRLGRPVKLDPATRRRIGRMRAKGATLRSIATRLNAEGVPTAHGGSRWHAETVAGVLRSLDLDTA